jgi:hypothetical protein
MVVGIFIQWKVWLENSLSQSVGGWWWREWQGRGTSLIKNNDHLFLEQCRLMNGVILVGVSSFISTFNILMWELGRSQWPRAQRCRSTAARLLRCWVRICVCCQEEVSATTWWLVQRGTTVCGASCVITKPRERGGHSPRWAAEPQKIINSATKIVNYN